MKLKLNLSLTAKAAQRYAQPAKTETQIMKAAPTTAACTARKNSPFALLATRSEQAVRIPPPIITVRPVFRGNKSYLRALRAAEMAAWNASIKFPTFLTLFVALISIRTN